MKENKKATAGELTHTGLDKLGRYKWTIVNKPGHFISIPKGDLKIDHSYQRDKINQVRVNEFSSAWDWVKMGVLSVSLRDGQWYVMDGQHRKLAADKRSDISELPCMVFDIEDQKTEAAMFVGLNSNKTAVSGVDRFKALLVAQVDSAVGLNKLLQSTGHKVGASASASVVSCIMCIWKCYERDKERMESLWPLIADVSNGHTVTDCLVRGIWGCEKKANEIGYSLTKNPYQSHLVQAGSAVLSAEIRREIAIVGCGGERVECTAVAKWLNRQRIGRAYQFPMA